MEGVANGKGSIRKGYDFQIRISWRLCKSGTKNLDVCGL